MIELTDLQEDILTLAVEDPDMTNEEIADVLDCSPDWVGEVRRKYGSKVNEEEINDELQTVSGTVSNPPQPEDEKTKAEGEEDESSLNILSEMRSMGPSTFQDFIADLWEKQDHEVEVADDHDRISLKTESGGGIIRSSTTTALQPVFREEGNLVTKSDMNGILEIRWEDDIDEIVVVTPTGYTRGAQKQGKRDEVTLLDGDGLKKRVDEENATGLIYKYGDASRPSALLHLFVILPLKLTWRLLVVSAQISWFLVTLPFKLLSGSSSKED